jgi:hypothetical protein
LLNKPSGLLYAARREKMEIDNVPYLVLYLTDWQKRMVRDILKSECDYLQIPVKGGITHKYGIRIPKNPKLKKMYLTEWQKNEMMDETGAVCNFIELDPSLVPLIVRYGMPEK